MSILLINGTKYNLRIPTNEKQLERIVKEHAKQIFGKDSLYFTPKEKIKSKAERSSIPDGYAISLYKPYTWYIVEVELSSHPPHRHLVPQLSSFISGIENPDSQRRVSDLLYKEISSNPSLKAYVEKTVGKEIHHFLSDLISEQPKFVVIVEEKTTKTEEACRNLKLEPQIVEFKTFAKGVGLTVHAHLICEPVEKDTHAKYDEKEKGFLCLMCKKQDLIYEVGEINKHLMERHDVDWDDQIIEGWTDKFEKQAKAYFSRKKLPI